MEDLKEVRMGRKTRKSFSHISGVMEMPNLISVQKESYQWFLDTGLREVFRDVSDINDYTGNLSLSFLDYRLSDTTNYSVAECKKRDASYSKHLYIKTRLCFNDTGEVKDEEVYMGDFPVMTEGGTFVINGAERVIISQLVRSPGCYYLMNRDKTGRALYSTTIIPNRGAWLEYETDQNDVFYVRIDKTRKIPVTTFIRALGLSSNEDILRYFGEDDRMKATLARDTTTNNGDALFEVYRKLRPGEPPTMETAQGQINNLFFDDRRYDISRVGRYKYNKKLALSDRLRGHMLAENAVDPLTGELIAAEGDVVDKALALKIENSGISRIDVICDDKTVRIISNGMVEAAPFLPQFTAEELDKLGVTEKVRFSILKEIIEECENSVTELIEDDPSKDYDTEFKAALAESLDERNSELIPRHIIIDDIFASINYVNCVACGVGHIDDIDHLGNRRIRSVGELLQNQFRIGFTRMERVVKERMSLQSQGTETVTPRSLINIRPVVAAVKEFFGSSPLSQFMDQTNPLAELTHKRRLSALGPGGLSRDRAGFEVRDVHYSHYGRMCPIETPEGPNIGLISYLATYARINKYGFIEAPFCPIDKQTGAVIKDDSAIRYMTADVEDEYVIAQANEPLDENNRFVNAKVLVRYRDEFREADPKEVDYMDVSPLMVVSVATAMIPFLEHDDAHRALMGSNMQRQAVPLLRTEAPIVGTGMEYKAAIDSGVAVLAKNAGEVTRVCADTVEVRRDDGDMDTYKLIKFLRSNQGTCINQRPIVDVGDRVEVGDVIADGPSTSEGEISLGRNMLIGFMTWEGYNYEDAVLLNERLVRDDTFTSIHIEKYECEARDTKLGPEEITRDIPNVGDDALKDLTDTGIIRVGAEVRSGDILVGKVTPKGETELTAEERLLRAIFGEKAKEVRDTSLKVPHGEYGIVVDVEVFTRADKSGEELPPGVNKVVRCYIAQKRKISVGDKMAGRHGNKGVVSRILPEEDMPFLPDGTPLDIVLNPLGVPSRMNVGQVLEVHLGRAARALGEYVMTPVFDGAHEEDIVEMLKQAGLDEDGKIQLYDGRTGRKFDNRVTVGVMYFLKLLHLVDDKIHARSTGPYSLVTQQPLGGKAQFGGQRFGEMEVWALEAYGAAYTLQEILTVKSDDVVGRVKTYEAIVKGLNVPKPGIPESFKVLVSELRSLALDVDVLDENGNVIDLKQDYDEGSDDYHGEIAEFKTENDAENASGFSTVTPGDEASGFTHVGESEDEDETYTSPADEDTDDDFVSDGKAPSSDDDDDDYSVGLTGLPADDDDLDDYTSDNPPKGDQYDE